MRANATIDNVAAYFPPQILIKISNHPTYDALTPLKKMVKANASYVITNVSGGAHDHLGLIISENKYTNITGHTYEKPNHPGDLKINENTPLHEAIIM